MKCVEVGTMYYYYTYIIYYNVYNVQYYMYITQLCTSITYNTLKKKKILTLTLTLIKICAEY